MGDEDSSTIPTRETNQFIESGADDLVPIPKESGETSNNDSECNMLDISLPTTDVREDNFVTFSNPLFDTSCSFNGGNYQRRTNVSFVDEFVHNPDPISNDETPDFSYPPSQPQTSSFDQFYCYGCGDLLEDGVRCQQCTCIRCRSCLREGIWFIYASSNENSSINDPNPNSFNDTPNIFTYPPQPQYETYSCELCGDDSHYGYDCPPPFPLVYEQELSYNQNFSNNYYLQNSSSFIQQYLCCDNCGVLMKVFNYSIDHQPPIIQQDLNMKLISDELMIEQRNELLKAMQSMFEEYHQREQAANLRSRGLSHNGNEDLSIISEKESNEVIKSSVEDLVPIPSESEDISKSDSECILPSCDDFSPINVFKEKSMTFSNPLFNTNEDFTSSDDESLSDEDVSKENVLENIESKYSCDSNFDELDLLVTPLFNVNKDECFDPGGNFDEIDAFLDIYTSMDIKDGYHDSKGDIMYLESLLTNETIPGPPSEVFLDHDTKSLKDESVIDDSKNMVKIFDPDIPKKNFSPTYCMSTRSNYSHLFPPLRDPESLIRRRNLGEPSSLFDFEEVMNNNHNHEPPPQNGTPPMVRPNRQDPRTMEELCQPSINGRGRPIASIPIQATDFGLRHHMIQQVQNMCQIHGLPGDDANRHIDKLLEITQHMKQNRVSNDALRLSPFPYSLMHHAIAWYDRLPRNSIHSFDDMMRKFLSKYFPTSMSLGTINAAAEGTFMHKTPEECYKLIENMTAYHNHWETSVIRDETSRNIYSTSTTESPKVVRQLKMMNKNFSEMMRQFQMIKAVDTKCTGSLPRNTVPNPREDLTVITTRSGVTLARPRFLLLLLKRNLHFELSFADDLLYMPKFALMFKSLLNNKEKLFDLATTSIWVSINLMPLSIWKKLSLPELTFTQMILELTDRSTTRPVGIVEDVFVKVGKFHFPTNFLVVDYVVDPRVPLILGRPFLRTRGALIDVYGEELTLCVDDRAITFKVGQTLKYSCNDAESINRVDIIDVACEVYVQKVLGFSDNSKSGNPTLISDPILALSSPSLTPFEGGDLILEEIEACLTSESIPPGIDDTDLDLEGDIPLLEEL
nr:reverse transcriptase domain-containing protein [Tanacetum cinerariifolium]